jgi:hypothetical protein
VTDEVDRRGALQTYPLKGLLKSAAKIRSATRREIKSCTGAASESCGLDNKTCRHDDTMPFEEGPESVLAWLEFSGAAAAAIYPRH